jgi:putative peptidoglycan lipid II flippase
MMTSYFFGAGVAADAFFVAFRLPNLLRRFVGEGAMSAAFIPVFAESLTTGGPAVAERALRAVATVFTLLLLALTATGIALAPYWLEILAPGFGAEPALMALTLEMTRWLCPYLLLIGLVALLGGFLNARRHFIGPALAGVALNLGMIAGVIGLVTVVDPPVFALVCGVLLGGALQLVIQAVPLARGGVSLAPLWAPRHPALVRVLRALVPSTFGAAVYQINVTLSTSMASLLAAGSVSALWYAGRLFEFPIGLVAVAIGTAALPSFAEQAVRGAHGEMRRSLTFAVSLTTLVAVPAATALVVLARPIIAVLLQHGAFGPEDVARTASALQAYAVGLWPLAVVRVVVPVFYALRDVRTPALAASVALVVNIVASLALIGAIVPQPAAGGLAAAIARAAAALRVADLGHAGLALAASLAAAANLVCLAVPLAQRLRGLECEPMVAALVRSALASVPMGVLVYATAGAVDWTASGATLQKALWLAAISTGGLLVFAATAALLGGPEVESLYRSVRERFHHKDTKARRGRR